MPLVTIWPPRSDTYALPFSQYTVTLLPVWLPPTSHFLSVEHLTVIVAPVEYRSAVFLIQVTLHSAEPWYDHADVAQCGLLLPGSFQALASMCRPGPNGAVAVALSAQALGASGL